MPIIKPNGKMLVVTLRDKIKKAVNEFGQEVELRPQGLRRVGIDEGKNKGKEALVRYIEEGSKVPDTDQYIIHEESVIGFIEDEDED